MFKRFWQLVDFIDSAYQTWRLKKENPGLYKFLSEYEFNEDDFEEVPGRPGVKIHKDALENMRKLGEE